MTTHPIVWTIAGSDSGGGAGIQADLHTFHDLDVHGCTVITALTAQNSQIVRHIAATPADSLKQQLQVLSEDLPPVALKLGMLADSEQTSIVADFLENYSGFVVCDPVMVSSSGASLLTPQAEKLLIERIIPQIDLITPNLYEAEKLAGFAVRDIASIEIAAKKLVNLGAKNVLIKGGHGIGEYSQDYFCSNKQCSQSTFWLTSARQLHHHSHGSGCTLSAAITALMARGFAIEDALVIAKMVVNQGLRFANPLGQGPGAVAHRGFPETTQDLPWVTATAAQGFAQLNFPKCNDKRIGFYPLIDSAAKIPALVPLGINTVQLRIKNVGDTVMRSEIKQAVELSRHYGLRLFINDYWQLAIEYGTYGVHLGQNDLNHAACTAIHKAGLRLGISTHGYYELARALSVQPSYIALGPIFATTSKTEAAPPVGLEQLKMWRKLVDIPLVAIGGINRQRLVSVLTCGVDGIAAISLVDELQENNISINILMGMHHANT